MVYTYLKYILIGFDYVFKEIFSSMPQTLDTRHKGPLHD